MRMLPTAAALLLLSLPARAFDPGLSLASSEASVSVHKFKATFEQRKPPTPPPGLTAPYSRELTVGDPWIDSVRQQLYNQSKPPSLLSKMGNGLILQNPLVPVTILAPIFDPSDKAMALKMAANCKARHNEWWDRIGCVSRAVHDELDDKQFNLPATPCKTHAELFNAAFAALGIRQSHVMTVDASGPAFRDLHVANAIFVRDELGRSFAYVIDTGWFPAKAFPFNDLAKRYHDSSRDGRTDETRLPRIDPDPVATFRPLSRFR